MEKNNIQVGTKKDTKKILRKVMFPMGLTTSIIYLVWMALHLSGVASTKIDFVQNMIDASRYIAIAAIFLAFIVCGLMIAHTVLQLVKIKGNVKKELAPGIINSVVGLLMFIFFIVLAVKVFNEEKWSYAEELLFINPPFQYGYDTYEVFAMMGIMFSLLVVCTVFAFEVDSNKKIVNNMNAKEFRAIAVSALIISLVAIAPIVFGAACGMENATDVYGKDPDKYYQESFRVNWLAAGMAIKFAYGIIGSIAIGMLFLIPLAILATNDKDERVAGIITWSIVGGVAIILFAIAASMMKINKADGYVNLWTSKWFIKTRVCSIFALITLVLGIVCGSMSFNSSNKFIIKTPVKQTTAEAIKA